MLEKLAAAADGTDIVCTVTDGGVLEVEIRDDGEVYMVGTVDYVGSITLGNELSEQLRALN